MRKADEYEDDLANAIAARVKRMALGRPNGPKLRRDIERLIASILEEQGPCVRTTVLVCLDGEGAQLKVSARMRCEMFEEMESRLSIAKVIPIKRGRTR